MPRRNYLKRKGKNLRLEVEAKSEKVEQDHVGNLPPFSTFFFFSMVYFILFFLFFLLEKKKMPKENV
jgi:hypothetical protein